MKLPHFLDIPSNVGATEPHAAVRMPRCGSAPLWSRQLQRPWQVFLAQLFCQQLCCPWEPPCSRLSLALELEELLLLLMFQSGGVNTLR